MYIALIDVGGNYGRAIERNKSLWLESLSFDRFMLRIFVLAGTKNHLLVISEVKTPATTNTHRKYLYSL